MNIIKKLLDSKDYGGTLAKVQAIVLHHSAGGERSMYSTFDNPNNYVSAHFAVDTDGKIYQYVPEDRVAWHGGLSLWGNMNGLNFYSLGIEVVSIDGKTYTEAQKLSTRKLLEYLVGIHTVAQENIVRHSDITQRLVANCENKILGPDADNEKQSRKWDIGENFFDGVHFADYRKSLYQSTMGTYETILKEKYPEISVVGNLESALSTKDSREVMALMLLLAENNKRSIEGTNKQVQEIPKAILQSEEVEDIVKALPVIKFQYNQDKDFWYNEEDSYYKWRNCTIIGCLTAIANKLDTELLKGEKKIMRALEKYEDDYSMREPTKRRLSNATRLIARVFNNKIEFSPRQYSIFMKDGVERNLLNENMKEGDWGVVGILRQGKGGVNGHAFAITKISGIIYYVDNYAGSNNVGILDREKQDMVTDLFILQ